MKMKRLVSFFMGCFAIILLSGCITDKHLSAGGDLLTAATVTNDDLIKMSKEMRVVGDKQNKVAPANNKYAQRLARLTNKLKNEDGLDLNFKVYITKDINANATADGSIRMYSGLMDMMTDDEIFYVIGHEIGHVKGGDSLNAIRVAYTTSGVVKAAGAASGTVAALTDSQLGDLLNAAVNAQFSQKQEYAADNYGYNMMKKYKVDTNAAVSALRKIDALGQSGGFLSSHPNSADRANKLENLIKSGK
ncbi:MAG: M48 family metallopeptidase [Syntrophobacterales bacterium]|jgi:putative metalloprotease|nr:M48 family metallopeptidase [Syntrophobacterales bacterium]